MSLYFSILKFAALWFFQYPSELFSLILRKIISLGFLILLWSIVAESGSLNKSVSELISYFLIADGLASLLMSFHFELGKTIRHSVKDGSMSNYFIKPIRIIPYLYALTFGKNAVNKAIAMASMALGIALLPNLNLTSFLLFLVTFVFAFILALSLNLFEGSLSFIITETTGIKNAIQHVVRILGGLMVPLYFFPEGLRKFAELTPFPAMIYGPTTALQSTELTEELRKLIVTGAIWAAILIILMLYFWKIVSRSYEAVGI